MRIPVLTLAAIQERFAPLLERLREAIDLPDDLSRLLVTGRSAPPAMLINLVGMLPASEAHHDCGPGGLAEHSLRVAIKAVELYQSAYPRPPEGEPLKNWHRSLCAVYLGALLHDVGKIWFIDVTDPKSGTNWPYHRHLVSWATEMQAEELEVRWRAGRTRGGPAGHEPLGIFYLSAIMPMAVVTKLGWSRANDLLASFLQSLGAETSEECFRFVKDADHQVTAAVSNEQRRKSTANQALRPGTGTVADDFLIGFRKVLEQDRRIRINSIDGHLYVSMSHTILWLSMERGASIMHLIYQAMASTVLPVATGYVRSFYSAGDAFAYIPEIMRRQNEEGTNWCVPNAGPGDTPQGYQHYVVALDAKGKAKRKGWALILRNNPLWDGLNLADVGQYQDLVSICGADRKTPSVDTQDLGFRSIPAHALQGKSQPLIPIASVVPRLVGEGVLDVETAAAGIVHELAQLMPQVADPERQQGWETLVSSIGNHSRLPPELLGPALEACLERLRLLRSGMETRSLSIGREVTLQTDANGAVSMPPDSSPRDLRMVIAGLIVAAREAEGTPPAEPFHAWRTPDGTICLSWPQCLQSVFNLATTMHISNAIEDIARELGLEYGGVKIKGLSYEHRDHHVMLIARPTWIPPTGFYRIDPTTIDVILDVSDTKD